MGFLVMRNHIKFISLKYLHISENHILLLLLNTKEVSFYYCKLLSYQVLSSRQMLTFIGLNMIFNSKKPTQDAKLDQFLFIRSQNILKKFHWNIKSTASRPMGSQSKNKEPGAFSTGEEWHSWISMVSLRTQNCYKGKILWPCEDIKGRLLCLT